MNWYIQYEHEGKEHLIPIEDYHHIMKETCETRGACAIAEYGETLRIVLDLWLTGRTTVDVYSRTMYANGFHNVGKECVSGWWGAE